ncbi:hypothetical protein SELMODRAFT_182858 [Selaginella moellendorffii]|uniref:Radical SAM core domain-containing protein n=1 Tax=Selaginella moellendorffii TaxID=88036 RepID=D8SUR4_SELML|nr:uncharacterized protein LOC9662820 [Selaginella moellendorffii]EFJ11884.1 hypothetical protein SELMODRAFT_182858 [Selaginella moellendorffii]|eukprot:XP_002987041.1 uncharacterized protein LOC9662820 [Selaginella moellendorffii]
MSLSSIFDEGILKAELQRHGIKPLHVYTIWRHVMDHPNAALHQVPGLPGALYPLLRTRFKALTSTLAAHSTSANGTTTKLLLQLQSGQSVETVIMRHHGGAGKYAGGPRPGSDRATLCVSSQVGCKMGCSFCATGTMGFVANLTAGEIVEQYVHASRMSPIRNIVFMGMGEPLNNYNSVVQAVQTLTGRCFGLSPSRITISTVGIVPRILSVAGDLPGVNLALSLHAPTQALRCQIVPASRAFTLDKLMAAVDAYQASSNRTLFIEYVMLQDVNDSSQDARQLGCLLRDRKVVLNLIPYNHTFVVGDYRATPADRVHHFQKIVREEFGIRTTVRQEMGQDIDGACGQLALKKLEASPDMEDIFLDLQRREESRR